MTTESSQLDINKLIDRPYSEMTDEEIEFVIDWKAQIRARDSQFEATLQAIKDGQDAQLKAMQEQAERDAKRQDDLLQASIERMRRAGVGQ